MRGKVIFADLQARLSPVLRLSSRPVGGPFQLFTIRIGKLSWCVLRAALALHHGGEDFGKKIEIQKILKSRMEASDWCSNVTFAHLDPESVA